MHAVIIGLSAAGLSCLDALLKFSPQVNVTAISKVTDVDAELPPQILDENVVTIIEKWESLQALRDHLETLHVLAYMEKVKNIVAGLSLKVLREA
jgi:quinol monooxygenase YgiN